MYFIRIFGTVSEMPCSPSDFETALVRSKSGRSYVLTGHVPRLRLRIRGSAFAVGRTLRDEQRPPSRDGPPDRVSVLVVVAEGRNRSSSR